MKALLVATAALLVGMLLLWREVRTSRDVEAIAAPLAHQGASRGAPVRALAPSTGSAPSDAAAPLGGVRPWSPTAAPTDGPDPFAPVPQVRTLAEAGLAD